MNWILLYIGIVLLLSRSTEGKPPTNDVPNELQGNDQNDGQEPLPEGTPKNTSKAIVEINILPGVRKCFPSDAFLRNGDGVKIQMKDVKVGEKVLTIDTAGRPTYSEIIMMLHRDSNSVIDEYVKIKTKHGAHLTLSTHHLIPLSSSEFIYSKDVRPGQEVTVYDALEETFHATEVVSVELVTKTGAYAPLSMEGTIVVNDVYASCYASFPSQTIAHASFSIWRVLYTHFYSLLSWPINQTGIHWYPRMLMSVAGTFGY